MLKILFVEDEEKIRDSCVRFLKLKGHHVREAGNGQQAVAMAAKEPFDLVIMDVKMPKLDGVSAYQQIRQACPAVRVILVTGYSANEELQQLAQDESVTYLRKPFTFETLSALIEELVGGGGQAGDASGV